ncbi:MAG TPA: cyclic nucleotide-binding domain-containing protein [Gaiellaceae bacterium]|nr:cyclic nucleotide-binding domain-containing protein [Gaiellaceae bacterium]
MLRRDAKLELLRRVPLFERCSRGELQKIAGLADELEVPAGKQLTQEGRTGYEFVVLVDGIAEVRRKGRRVNLLYSGDFLGEIALITGAPRTATVTTTVPSQVLVVTARDFRKLLRETPSIQVKVLEALAARLPDEAS